MKRNPLLWPLAGVGLLWLLLAFRPAPPQLGGGEKQLLDIKDFGLRKNQPTNFTFPVSRGDVLVFDCGDCEILLDRGRIDMQISSPDGAEIIPLSQRLLQGEVRLSGEGLYKLQIKTGRNFVRIAELKVLQESDTPFPGPEEPQTLLDLEQVYIGEEQGKNRTHPRFFYRLNAADTLHISASGINESKPAGLTLSYGLVGQPISASGRLDGSGGFNIPISQPGTFFVEFSAEDRRFYDFQKDFYNLTIRKVPKSEEEFVEFGGSAQPEAPAEEEDPMAILLKELIDMQREEPQEGLQPLNRISPPPFSVSPQQNLAGSNCTCGQIPLPNADILVYWLGVNKKGHQAFKQIEDAHLSQDRLSPGLFFTYAKSLLYEGREKTYLFNDTNLDITFYEDVEWAIVNSAGKVEFEAGRIPRSSNMLKNGGRINSAYGYIPNVAEGEYFLCFRNDNPRSAVQVAIDFQLFNKTLTNPDQN